MEIIVQNAEGSSRWPKPSCKCSTWIEHWYYNSEEYYPDCCPGCGEEIDIDDWKGAHVRKVDSNDKDYYITPLCHACNMDHGLKFVVDERYLVKARADQCILS